jgi:predicted Na+-dependent transporter
MWKKFRGVLLIILGYLLSPLSWWNDLFFNLPIAYGIGYLLSLPFPDLLLPMTVVGYWISNILGFIFMQMGATDTFLETQEKNFKKDLLISLATSTFYTFLVVALVKLDIFKLPFDLAINP